jgi:phosphoglycolate phosphatase
MTGRTYDFWLLDLDGTVVDVEPGYVHEVVREVGDRLGHGFSDRECEAVWYGSGRTRERVFADRGIEADAFWSVFHEVDEPEPRAAATYVYDDAAGVAALDRVGLVTHCQPYLTDPILDALDIRDWFDTVVCCTPETGWKPDPSPVRLAMDDLGVGSEAGVMAGDAVQDVQAAHNAGLAGVHVTRPHHLRDGEGPEGVRRVRRLTELPAWPA